jgi:hypothetical protein
MWKIGFVSCLKGWHAVSWFSGISFLSKWHGLAQRSISIENCEGLFLDLLGLATLV